MEPNGANYSQLLLNEIAQYCASMFANGQEHNAGEFNLQAFERCK